MDGVWHDFNGVLFFNIVSVMPSRMKVSKFASKVRDSGSLAISKVDVRQLHIETHTINVRIEPSEQSYVLTPSTLIVDPFSTCRVWEATS